MFNDLTFDDYQEKARFTAFYPSKLGTVYVMLGLIGELGELVEKLLNNISIDAEPSLYTELQKIFEDTILTGKKAEFNKKLLRDGDSEFFLEAYLNYAEDTKTDILKELGDVLWYLANLSQELDTNLNTVASINLEKLAQRALKGKLRGSGDNR